MWFVVLCSSFFFFFKQKTAYEMRISDWSSDVCSSDLIVDFNQDHCIGCGYCITGCPFDIPRISEKDKKAYKCTLCSDRVSVGQIGRASCRERVCQYV